MAIQVEVRENVLAVAITEFVQTQLFTTCTPALPGLFVDHLDAIQGSAHFDTTPNGQIMFALDIAVHIVTADAVMANPNAMPATAMTAVGSVGVAVVLAMVGTRLVVASATSSAAGLPLPPSMQAVIEVAINAALAPLAGQTLFDTAAIVAQLSTVVQAQPAIERADGVVAMTFGATGPLHSQLASAHQWGVFLDQKAATGLLVERLPAGLPVNVRWQPNGATPAIVADLNVAVEGLGIEVAGASAVATASPTLEALSTLKLAVAWSLNLSGLASAAGPLARKLIRQEIRRQLPGATHDGAQSFYFTVALPTPPAILGAQPVWASISSSAAGMTIGGPVRPALPAARRGLLDLTVHRFGQPVWWGHCRQRAASGSGKDPTLFAASDVRAESGVSFDDAGALCSAELLAPNDGLAPLLGASVGGVGFKLDIPTAEKLKASVQILARTARGTRLLDLGRPSIVRNPDGTIGNVQVNSFNDCLHFSGAWLKLVQGESLSDEDFRPVPFEDPNWLQQLAAERGLNVHLVTIAGLEPGEIVSLHGPGLAIDVSANALGQASIPAMVGLAPAMREVRIGRLSRRPITGPVRIQTTEFTWLATVGPAEAAVIRDVDDVAHIERRSLGRNVVETYRPDGPAPFVRVRERGLASLNPQPLPPEPPATARRLVTGAGVDEYTAIAPLPGFDGSTLVLVKLYDDSVLIIENGEHKPRIAGRFKGSLPEMQIDGNFAIAMRANQVELYAVYRPEEVKFNC